MTAHRSIRPVIAALLLSAAAARADTFHVTAAGADAQARDGRGAETAWASLAYACERVPAGDHTIQLGPGRFVAQRTARPKSGVTIAGTQRDGENATTLIAASDWPLCKDPRKGDISGEFLIAVHKKRGKAENVTVRHLTLASDPAHRITGAVLVRGARHGSLHHLHVRDFRWSGIRLEHSSDLDVHHSRLHNAATDKFGWHGGAIRTRWIKHSAIHHNRISSDEHGGGGYGYKAGGHEGVRIHHNHFDIHRGFAIESAHENEYGVEVDHNFANRCISIPKGGQGADPNERGYPYSFWIHHNVLTDSYTIEGPRNHLLFERNYVPIAKPNGRVYTHHGGKNHGPIWIRHNVITGVDRAFVWMNQGLAENIRVYNNTVFCAVAGKRAGILIDSYRADRLNNWVVKNNVFVAPDAAPRKLIQTERGVPDKVIVQGNLCINCTAVPEGNFTDADPGLRRKGETPWPFFAPAGPESFVVDKGLRVGLPYRGSAPDLGAYEHGIPRPFPAVGPAEGE